VLQEHGNSLISIFPLQRLVSSVTVGRPSQTFKLQSLHYIPPIEVTRRSWVAAWGLSLPSVDGEGCKGESSCFQPMWDTTLLSKATFLLDQLGSWFFFVWGNKTLSTCTSGKEMYMASETCTPFSPELCLLPFCILLLHFSRTKHIGISAAVWVLYLPLLPFGGWELKLDLLHKEHSTVQCDSATESPMLQTGFKLNCIYKFIFLQLLPDHNV